MIRKEETAQYKEQTEDEKYGFYINGTETNMLTT
jgi:hypothetical protein